MQSFPHPNDATHKIWSILAIWLQRYSSSKVWNFHHTRASNSKMSGRIRPKTEVDWAFMPVLVTSNFDDDSIKKERASMATPFSHYKSYGKFFGCSRAANSVVRGPIWPKFKCVRDFMHVLVTCNSTKPLCLSWLSATLMMIRSKMNELAWRQHFPNISLWEMF